MAQQKVKVRLTRAVFVKNEENENERKEEGSVVEVDINVARELIGAQAAIPFDAGAKRSVETANKSLDFETGAALVSGGKSKK